MAVSLRHVSPPATPATVGSLPPQPQSRSPRALPACKWLRAAGPITARGREILGSGVSTWEATAILSGTDHGSRANKQDVVFASSRVVAEIIFSFLEMISGIATKMRDPYTIILIFEAQGVTSYY